MSTVCIHKGIGSKGRITNLREWIKVSLAVKISRINIFRREFKMVVGVWI